MTPNDFEKWQEELETPLNIDDFNLSMDMMSVEDDIVSPIEHIVDGFGITAEGKVVYSDRETVKYLKAFKKQKVKKTNHLRVIK